MKITVLTKMADMLMNCPEGVWAARGLGNAGESAGGKLTPGVTTFPAKEAGCHKVSRDPGGAQWSVGVGLSLGEIVGGGALPRAGRES